jgi:hypothetical protein
VQRGGHNIVAAADTRGRDSGSDRDQGPGRRPRQGQQQRPRQRQLQRRRQRSKHGQDQRPPGRAGFDIVLPRPIRQPRAFRTMSYRALHGDGDPVHLSPPAMRPPLARAAWSFLFRRPLVTALPVRRWDASGGPEGRGSGTP